MSERNDDWGAELKWCIDSLEHAGKVVRQLQGRLRADLGDAGAPKRELIQSVWSHVAQLNELIKTAREAAEDARDRYALSPTARYLRGDLLSREEYSLLVAMDVGPPTAKDLGLGGFDDYDVFRLLHYDDRASDVTCYINPDLRPRGGGERKLAIFCGRAPEELRLDALRDDQREFFEKYLPEVHARFQRGE